MKGSKLAEIRKSKGMTQQDLAEITGISRVVISRYEKDTHPSRGNLKKIIDALNLPKDYFFEEALNDDEESAIDSIELKKKLNEVFKFSPREQRRIVEQIDLTVENQLLKQKLEKIKNL